MATIRSFKIPFQKIILKIWKFKMCFGQILVDVAAERKKKTKWEAMFIKFWQHGKYNLVQYQQGTEAARQ